MLSYTITALTAYIHLSGLTLQRLVCIITKFSAKKIFQCRLLYKETEQNVC